MKLHCFDTRLSGPLEGVWVGIYWNHCVHVYSDAMQMAKRLGLPTDYKCEAKILKRVDRDKLDAKACPDCKKVLKHNT
jgi:hypothetical protein